jgi:hypothetical protein
MWNVSPNDAASITTSGDDDAASTTPGDDDASTTATGYAHPAQKNLQTEAGAILVSTSSSTSTSARVWQSSKPPTPAIYRRVLHVTSAG